MVILSHMVDGWKTFIPYSNFHIKIVKNIADGRFLAGIMPILEFRMLYDVFVKSVKLGLLPFKKIPTLPEFFCLCIRGRYLF